MFFAARTASLKKENVCQNYSPLTIGFFFRHGLHGKHGFHRFSLFFFCEIRVFRVIRA